MYGNYNQQLYQQDLLAMRERLDKQLQQFNQMPTNHQVPQINQNFQLAPNTNNGIKYVEDINEVKKELVFNDTLFVNKDYSLLWLKNAMGEIKTFSLNEIIEVDEKDRKINELMAKIERLESEMLNNESATNDNEYVDARITNTKSSRVSKSKSSNK